MVDSEDLVLLETVPDRLVDGAVGGQVMPQWFLQHNAELRSIKRGFGQLLTHGTKKAGGSRKVHHHGVRLA